MMRKPPLFVLVCLLLLTAASVSAQKRRQTFKFAVTTVDAKTHKPRSIFFLGESVHVRFSLTNQSRVAQTIPRLPDTPIKFKLHSTNPYEYAPSVEDGYFGGTDFTEHRGNMIIWGSRPPRMMTIAPGQTVSQIINLDELDGHPLEDGTHTLTAHYNSRLQTTTSFRVIVDEAKSFPLLEKLAASPEKNGDNTLQRWARATLNLEREPLISGRIVDDEGRPLNEVRIEITGSTKSNTESRKTGRYRVELLKIGGTYTIKPSIVAYHGLGETCYTIEPASKTITLLTRRATNVDFIARRVRTETNFALDDEGSKARASSVRDWMFEPERVIDRYRMVPVGESVPEYWNDATPNVFPDWIEVDFDVTRKLNWINVFTLPDNLNDPPDPDLNEKFSLYGITDFDVQYWTQRGWVTVPGGAIRGNRNVWRKISFPEITTRKIRVVVLNALGGESRITEIEAFHLNDLPQAKITVGGQGKRRKSATVMGHTDAPLVFRTDASDPDGAIHYYELDFGDDTPTYVWRFDRQKALEKPQLTHTHVYTTAGTYNVTLSVVDNSGEVTDTALIVTITDPQKRKGRN